MKHESRYLWLDLIRGLSALLVTLHHLRHAVFVDYPDLPGKASALLKVFYFFTSLGHISVIMFFVLSGFFVGGSVLNNVNNFSWPSYLTARVSRLWVVLLPSLIFTYILGAYFLPIEYSDGKNSQDILFSTFIGNVFFLQTIFVSCFGVNGPLWSLSNEFWYYLTFPLALYSLGFLSKCASWLKRIFTTICTLLILSFMPTSMLCGGLVWLVGVLVWYCLRLSTNVKKDRVGSLMLLAIIVFVGSVIFNKMDKIEHLVTDVSTRDILVAISFGFVSYQFAKLNTIKMFGDLFRKFAMGVSEISYSQYLSHFPIVFWIGSSFYHKQKLVPSTDAFAQFFLWFTLIIIIAILFWWLFERHTNLIRKNLVRYFKVN